MHVIEGFLTSAEAAKRLGISAQTLVGWRCRGLGPRYAKIGRGCYYRPEDVTEWLQGRMVDPAAKKTAGGVNAAAA